MTRVAFLGLGRMGAPMAGRLSKAGHDLVVWSRTRAHAAALAGRAEVAASPAEAGSKAEVAITMLTDGGALEEVVLGRDGLADGLGSGSLLIDMSTTGPAPARKVAKELYGVEIGQAAGLPSGTVHPILARLETVGWLTSRWEQIDPRIEGRPTRRYYRLTPDGLELARDALARAYTATARPAWLRPLGEQS